MFYKGEIPFVRLSISLICGIVLAYYYPFNIQLNSFLQIAVVIVSILTILNLLYKHYNLYRYRQFTGILVFLFIAFSSYFLTITVSQKFDKLLFSNFSSEALVVRVSNEPKLVGDILRFESKVIKRLNSKQFYSVNGKLLIALKLDSIHPMNINYGDELLIPIAYHEIEAPYNPAEFNFKEYLASKQIYYQSFINQYQLQILKRDNGNPIISYSFKLRQKLVTKFYNYLPNKESAAVASTLILGYRADLNKEIINAYSKTGTMHVLSVSGMHVGIIFIVLTFIFSPFRKHKQANYVVSFFIILLIWFYSMITGFSPSVCRSAVMLTFFVLGKSYNKQTNTYNIIAFSAFVLLLYNPFYLVDVGFQLSYIAVLGLIFFHPRIYNWLDIRNKYLDKAWSYCALSLSAQLATFPLSLYYFHQFPIYFLISNLFIVIPILMVMYFGIGFLFIPWKTILIPLGVGLSWIISLVNNVLHLIEKLPFSSLGGIWITWFQQVLLYILIGLLIWALIARNKKALVFALFACMLFVGVIGYSQIEKKKNRSLIFYSLRKNTAIAYLNGNEAVLISDLSKDDKTASFSIKPSLDSLGIQECRFTLPDVYFTSTLCTTNKNSLNFENFNVLRWTKAFNKYVFIKKINADAVLISYNPTIKISDLRKYVQFKILLIDGTNSDYRINKWKIEADNLKVAYHLLKKNNAYLVKL